MPDSLRRSCQHTINGNVAMAGTMMPGLPGTPGALLIFGNYEQTGTGTFEELIGPLSHSFLDVSGNVALDSGSQTLARSLTLPCSTAMTL